MSGKGGARTALFIREEADFTSLFRLIESAGKPFVLALDGFCASGKTTLAALIAERYGARVIHTDDFYLPRDMRNDARYAEPTRVSVCRITYFCEHVKQTVSRPLDGG